MTTNMLVRAAGIIAVAAVSFPSVALARMGGRANARQTASSAPAQNAASKPSVLDTDPRLRIKVNITEQSVTMAQALRILSSMTQVSFVAEGNEVQLRKQSFTFRLTPLRDVLDSLTALYGYEWERRDSGVLVLRVKRRVGRGGLPLIGGEDAVDGKAEALKDQFDKLPADQQAALTGEDSVSVADLPPGMQVATRGLLEQEMTYFSSAQSPFFAGRADGCQRILENFDRATVRIQMNGPEQGGGYFITIGAQNIGSIGQHFPLR
jgi:hypothetical protein